MKRSTLTKITAGIAAVLVMSATVVLPIAAAGPISITLCTAEQEDTSVSVDTLTANSGTNAGNTAPGTNAGNNNVPGTAGDAIGGNTPAGDLPNDPANGTNNDPANGANGTNDTTAGNGNLNDGQAGGDENGVVGDEPIGDGTIVDDITGNDAATADNANNADNAGNADTAANGTGTNWASIIIALVIAVALIVVIVALIPRKRTD